MHLLHRLQEGAGDGEIPAEEYGEAEEAEAGSGIRGCGVSKREFKVEEKVAAYDMDGCRVGVVRVISADGTLHVRFKGGALIAYHPKACRHLKPKAERRRIWALLYEDGTYGFPHTTKESAVRCSNNLGLNCIPFIEVRVKKESK